MLKLIVSNINVECASFYFMRKEGVIDIIQFFIVMLLGIGLGTLIGNHKIIRKINTPIQHIAIAILILSMGISLGSSPTFLQDLSQLGFKAVVFGVMTVLFSILCVYLLTFKIKPKKKPQEEEIQ